MMLRVISIFVVAALCLTGTAGIGGWTAPEPAGSAEAALTRALEHAGLTADQVTEVRTEYEVDRNGAEYEIEFRDGDWEYSYEIHADTGEILEADREYEPQPAAPPAVRPAPEEPSGGQLSADEAKAAALEHAGLTEAEVSRLRAESDVEDGIRLWEIEFRHGGWEYEYEIHAATGQILSRERENDP